MSLGALTATKSRSFLGQTRSEFSNFASAPASPFPLGVLRILICGVLIAQAISIAPNIQELYGSRGVVQWAISDPADAFNAESYVPRIRWIVEALASFGVQDATCVRAVFVAYVASLGFLLIGWRTRIAAVTTWLLHLALNTSGTATIYGVDMFANIALFYMTWMPVGSALSADVAARRLSPLPSSLARLSIRVLQIHMCIVYIAGGVEKSSGEQWWNGEAMWRALTLPGMAQFDFAFLADYPWIPVVLGWKTLFLEACYPLLVIPRRIRPFAVLAIIGLHVGIGLTMGLVSFSCVMIALNVCAFLIKGDGSRFS